MLEDANWVGDFRSIYQIVKEQSVPGPTEAGSAPGDTIHPIIQNGTVRLSVHLTLSLSVFAMSSWRRYLFWLLVAPLVALGCLLIVVIDPDTFEYISIGYLIGTVFGQATLASAWTAFGPLPLMWRLPLALVWLVVLTGSIVLQFALHGGGPKHIPFIIGVSVAAHFVVLQILLWGLVIGIGLRLRNREPIEAQAGSREYQFGIRQLMISTAIIGVLFGVGRLTFPSLVPSWDDDFIDPVFVFLAVASIALSLPLLLSALWPRYSISAVLVVLIGVGLATAWELPLLERLAGNGPETLHLVWINFFNAAWILAIVLVARVSGYRLGRAEPGRGQAMKNPVR